MSFINITVILITSTNPDIEVSCSTSKMLRIRCDFRPQANFGALVSKCIYSKVLSYSCYRIWVLGSRVFIFKGDITSNEPFVINMLLGRLIIYSIVTYLLKY